MFSPAVRLAAALSLCAAACGTVQAQSIYAKAGFLGAGIGASYGLSPAVTLRADVTTAGSLSRSGSTSDFDYRGKLRVRQAGGYVDWFPFDNGFRLSVGLQARDARLDADARPRASGTITIGGTTVGFGSEDRADARATLPTVAPYVGLGWGHNTAQRASKPGFGFIADLGVAFGKPKVDFWVSDSVRTKLDVITGGRAQDQIDRQRDEFQHDVDKLKVLPQAYVGVAYYF